MYEYQYKKGDHVSDWCGTKEEAKNNFIMKYGQNEFLESTLLTRPKK
ncbi:hypothetical protein [Arcobacter venerupis]|nr:hypothetical protein [Arcobacter venerupis]